MPKVNREQFLHCLESVQPGLSTRDILEQSSSFCFLKGEVLTFNDETACRMPVPLNKDVSGAVRSKPLLDILQKLPEDELSIDLTEEGLIIRGVRRKVKMLLEKEVVLPIHLVETPTEWHKLHHDFGEAINVVQKCAGEDEKEFSLVCVHIHSNWIEASDNFQICRWPMKTGVKEPILVRQKSIKAIATLGMTEFSETKSWVHFRNPNKLVLSVRRYVEQYPDFTKYLEVEGGVPTVLPKGIAEACDKANVFSQENADQNHVTVELRPGKMRIRGLGISGEYTEVKDVTYAGPPMEFVTPPELLADLVKRHSSCVVTSNRIKADGGSYTYISCLRKPKGNGRVESDNGGEE